MVQSWWLLSRAVFAARDSTALLIDFLVRAISPSLPFMGVELVGFQLELQTFRDGAESGRQGMRRPGYCVVLNTIIGTRR